MIRKQRLCHDSLFKSMETKNVIELSAFSKSLSKKITYLNHEERILIDIEQIAAITSSSEREDLPKKKRRKHSHTCDTICRANKIRSKERSDRS